MWQAVLLAVSFFVTCGLVVVIFVRFFLLKSSREAPVFRLKPNRSRSVERNVEKETCRWASLLLDELKSIYVDPLQRDGRLRRLLEKKLTQEGRSISINALDIGDTLPELKEVYVKYDGGASELTCDASIVYSGSFSADITATCSAGKNGLGRCVVPLGCALSNATLEADIRITWDILNQTSRFSLSFLRMPSTSLSSELSLGAGPKAIQMPYVTDVLGANLSTLFQSLVHPDALKWTSPLPLFPSLLRHSAQSPESHAADTPPRKVPSKRKVGASAKAETPTRAR